MKRRKFLKNTAHVAYSSAYLYGLQSLFDLCMKNTLAQAQASSAGVNYVLIQMPGGPPRWYFDQPLNPNNKNSEFIAGNFGTILQKSGASYMPKHVGEKINFGGQSIHMPPVWKLTSAGTGEPFQKILDHTLMIRGLDMEINSHPVNRRRVVRPVASRPSIQGLVADSSGRPIAATVMANTEASRAFFSETGVSAVEISPGNPIPAITDSFKMTDLSGKNLKPQIENSSSQMEVEQILSQLDQYAKDGGLSSQGAVEQQIAAYDMFQRNLVAYNGQWNTLYRKYQNIMRKELGANFPGVTHNDLESDGSVFFNLQSTSIISEGTNLKETLSKGNINRIAQAFAFAEFALKEKLTSSISLDMPGTIFGGPTGLPVNVVADQHFVGSVVSVFYTSLFYRVFLGCLTEFKKFLEAQGEFDNTVIQIMTEFSRTPKADGSGADHGFNSSSATIISGMIKTPGLIGNIYKQSQNAATRRRYPGTWGEAAPFIKGEDRPILNDDVVQTICEMLGVRKIAVKGQSLVTKRNGSVELAVNKEAKNV